MGKHDEVERRFKLEYLGSDNMIFELTFLNTKKWPATSNSVVSIFQKEKKKASTKGLGLSQWIREIEGRLCSCSEESKGKI